MTYAYLNYYVSYVFYSYSYMPTSNLLWLPVVYHAYLHVVYYGYLWSIVATRSLLWLPVVYYGYL